MVRLLIARSANLNVEHREGKTALRIAMDANEMELPQILQTTGGQL